MHPITRSINHRVAGTYHLLSLYVNLLNISLSLSLGFSLSGSLPPPSCLSLSLHPPLCLSLSVSLCLGARACRYVSLHACVRKRDLPSVSLLLSPLLRNPPPPPHPSTHPLIHSLTLFKAERTADIPGPLLLAVGAVPDAGGSFIRLPGPPGGIGGGGGGGPPRAAGGAAAAGDGRPAGGAAAVPARRKCIPLKPTDHGTFPFNKSSTSR
jgi:hypothetical protein